jgi:hypothetical protein
MTPEEGRKYLDISALKNLGARDPKDKSNNVLNNPDSTISSFICNESKGELNTGYWADMIGAERALEDNKRVLSWQADTGRRASPKPTTSNRNSCKAMRRRCGETVTNPFGTPCNFGSIDNKPGCDTSTLWSGTVRGGAINLLADHGFTIAAFLLLPINEESEQEGLPPLRLALEMFLCC